MDFDLSAVVLIIVTGVLSVSLFRSRKHALSDIPTVGGSSFPIISYIGAFRCLLNAGEVIQEGYDKYKGGIFKYATLFGWQVIVTGPRLTDELNKAPDDIFSFEEFVHHTVQDYYTMGPTIYHNLYHVSVIRSQLTRSLDKLFPIIHDEIVTAFEDGIPNDGKEWTSVPAMDLMMDVICRTSGRILVGVEKCRDPDYRETSKAFNMDVLKGSAIINMFPDSIKPFVGWFFMNSKSVRRAVKHLEPIILERFKMFEEYGTEWSDKPDDFLQWLIETAEEKERTVVSQTLRILGVNFASMHTTNLTFTHALYYLAAYPEYVEELREEVEGILKTDGWTKAALLKMRKVDSFLKESQRINTLAASTLSRVALKDFTFSDGTFIPAGTFVSAAMRSMHLDDTVYPDSHVFNPWRFWSLRQSEGEGSKHQMVTTSIDYLTFAHGRHACPGRFFAATELKAMLAHIITTYDVKMEKGNGVPPTFWIGILLMPSPTARVLFRKRQPCA